MKIFLSCLLFVISTQAFSQNLDSLNYCVVVLNDSGVYVPSMKLRIVSFKKEDDFLKNSTTDFSGTACLTLAHGRVYNLIIDDSLYTRVKKKITFDNTAKFLNDTIFLSAKITSTDVINVEAQKDFMHMEDEKIIFDISKMKIDPGPDGLELMKRIPMVTVEGETVLLRGEAPKILINGRESQIYGDLKSIPTDLIDKVEVMTVAPAKYESEGTGGVINIVLKKMEDAKYKISFNGYGNSNSYAYLSQNFNYKKDKSSFFLNTGERLTGYKTYSYSTSKNLSTGEIYQFSTDTSTNNSSNYRINPGMIYDASKNLYFGIEGVLNLTGGNNNGQSYRKYSYLPDRQTLYKNGSRRNKDYSVVAYINQSEITQKDELNLEFNLNNTKFDSDYDQIQYLNNIYTPFTNGTSDIKNNNYNIKLDYSKRFNDDLKFETGLHDVYKKETNENFSIDTGVFAANYEFKQSIYSYYGTLSFNNRSVRIKTGLRIEYADMRGLVNASSQFTNYQFDIFPSITVAKYFSDNSELQLTYGKRIERPRFTALNPFQIRNDIYYTSTGNPDLQPSYTHNLELKFRKPLNKNYLSANVFFRHNTNLIQNYRYIDSIYTRSNYINDGYSNDYGTDASLQLAFGEFFSSSFSGRVSKKIFSNDSLNLVSDRVSYNFSLYCSYSNPDLFNVGVNMYYFKQSNSPLSISEPFSSVGIDIGKYFFDKKLNINLSLNDIFNKSVSESTYIRNGYEQYLRSEGAMGRSLSFNVRFTFGNYDEKRQKGNDLRGEDYGD